MKILAVDVGGTNVKVLASGHRVYQIKSGPRSPAQCAREATADWNDRVSISCQVLCATRRSRPVESWPHGMVRFREAAQTRIVNDAAMQALGSYGGRGTMLFLGLGTGLGTALIQDGAMIPLELAHLPYYRGKTYEDWIGEAGFRRLGKRRWRQHVLEVVELFSAAFLTDYVVLGGGNVRHMKRLPRGVKRGENANAFLGGYRLWKSSPASWRAAADAGGNLAGRRHAAAQARNSPVVNARSARWRNRRSKFIDWRGEGRDGRKGTTSASRSDRTPESRPTI
jgi:hypothetical protein